MFILSKKNNRAFTLVEAMVAVSVLMMAVIGPLTIAQKGLSSAIYSKDQMIASYLAQDAIEYIKNIRDNNGIMGISSDWLYTLENCVQTVSSLEETINRVCSIDTTKSYSSSNNILSGSNSLYIKSIGNLIIYTLDTTGNTKSRFTREVNIRRKNNNDEAFITVKVYWNDIGSSDNSVIVKSYIYNIWENMDGAKPTL